jgi:L-alanine-DL-glutamate epimerase-like enolase superfamily enzyme
MLSTRWSFREVFEKQATSVAMLDIGWCGGSARRRRSRRWPRATSCRSRPHDCTGPVLLTASVHLAMASPNALVQEVVRAFYFGWYRELVDDCRRWRTASSRRREAPGLGIALKPGLRDRPGRDLRASVL